MSLSNTAQTAIVGTGTAILPGAGTAIGAAVAAAVRLIGGIKAGTPHLTRQQSAAFYGPVVNQIWTQIINTLPASAVAQISPEIQNAVLNFMSNTSWWKVGNDPGDRVHQMNWIATRLGSDLGHGSLYIMSCAWIGIDSPGDNAKEGLTRIDAAFQSVLYPSLAEVGYQSLADVISNGLLQQAAVTPGSFNGVSTPQASVTQASATPQLNNAGFSPVIMFLLAGAALAIIAPGLLRKRA